MIIGIVFMVIELIIIGTVAAVSYDMGKEKGESSVEICCNNCKFKKDCMTYKRSDCTWCEEFEPEN